VALGILGFNVAGAPQQDGVVKDIVVAGNFIAGKTNVLTGADHIDISGNTIFGPTLPMADAILVSTSGSEPPLTVAPTNVTIRDNSIRGAARYGIFAGGASSTVQGNRIAGTSGAGIFAGPGATIDSNVVVEGGAGGILVPGQRAKVLNNRVLRGGDSGAHPTGDVRMPGDAVETVPPARP
jgi:hypothetical protein